MSDAPNTFEGASRPLLTATSVTAVITNRRPLISGSGFTWTNLAGQLTLSKTGFLSGITLVGFEQLYVVSGTGLTTLGYVRVASKTDNNSCVLLDDLGTVVAADVVMAHGINPFTIVVSAEDSTCDGTTTPKKDLQHAWNFGDAGNTRTVQMWDGSVGAFITVNANTGQKGLKAAYVYENPGTYTITLEEAAYNGTTTITNTTTLQIVVAERPRTNANLLWFDGTNGNSANDALDPNGFGITDGAYNNTTGAFTFTATAKTTSFTTAGFSNFKIQEQCPDWVWLKTGTGGSFVAKRARILAKVSSTQFTLETGLFSGNVTAMTTSSGPQQTYTDIKTAFEAGNYCMLARGGTYTNASDTGAMANAQGAGLWDYGTGAAPIMERGPISITTDGLIQIKNGRGPAQFGNINFRTGSGGIEGYILTATDGGVSTRYAADVLVYQNSFTADFNPINFQSSGIQNVIWGNTFSGAVTKSGMVLIQFRSDLGFIGNTKTGGFSGSPLSHHFYLDCDGPDGAVIAYNSGITTVSGGIAGHTINVNIASAGAGDVVQSRNWLIRGNYCGTGTNHGIDTSQVNNAPLDGRGSDIIIEKNTILCGAGVASARAFGCTGGEDVVWRRNWVSSPDIIDLLTFDGTPKNFKPQWYLNEVYLPKASTTDISIDFGINTDGYVAGCQFEQNRIWRSANNGSIASYKSATPTYWTIADNTWYTPNEASPFHNLTTVQERTLTQFKTDISNTTDVETQPNWANAASANFGVPSGGRGEFQGLIGGGAF